MELLFWPVFCALIAYMQGALMPAIRRTPPGAEAKRQAFALHIVGGAVYFLPLVVFVYYRPELWAEHLTSSVASRILLFDVVLNTAALRPPFEVGKTALTDRLLRRLWPAHPELLSAGIRGLVLVGVVVWLAW
ncbi:hypothetical protein [Hymenobacter tenuis]